MPREINWRIFFIIAVTVVCLFLMYPTARYFGFLALTERPTEAELLANWEDKADKLKKHSIKLGLDLQGGVDLLLEVDLDKTAGDLLRSISYELRRSFQGEDISAMFKVLEEQRAIRITLTDTKDYSIARGVLDKFKEQFADYEPERLKEGSIVLTIASQQLRDYADDAVIGSHKVVRRRVDELGLTQPVVARQGEHRIRVQLPGEKDPERVIKNILKPAVLEFRLVHDDSDSLRRELFDEDNNLQPGKQPPPGYVIRDGKFVSQDERTGKRTTQENVPYILKDKIELTGQYLKNAWMEYAQYDPVTPIHVNLEFDSQGARIFREVTANNQGRNLAILLDNYVYSAPVIDEVIPHGRGYIRGDFTAEEGRELSLVLKAGALPAVLKPIEKRAVGATLGTDSIRDSVRALMMGGVAVVAFVVIYYGGAGLIATFALLLNVLLIVAILSLARASLTLSGIGGILLTIGIAVDGNVLIYERIREELRTGKPLKAAVRNGFNRAFSVILDSNLTTLITALVLLQFAEGSVKGFALTMSIGLLANLYTSLTVTRTFTELWLYWKNKINVGKIMIFKKADLDFINLRNFSVFVSAGLIVLCVATMITYKGPSFAVDFSGGVLSDVAFTKPTTESEVRTALRGAGISGEKVQKVLHKNEFLVKVKLINNDLEATQNKIETALTQGFDKGTFQILSTRSIGNEVGSEFSRIALTAVIIATICILIYVGMRFLFAFGIAAVVALLHDVFITLGLITLLKVDISLDVVSALLIVLGYSINDTIVIFDRIRENMRTVFGRSFKALANSSINQSINRTLITSLTSLFAVTAMYVVGGKGLQPFALTLIIGVMIGTYSSSFVATPVLYEWNRRKGLKVEKEREARAVAIKATNPKGKFR